MKPSDFARKAVGGKYLDRTDTFFDKALNRNGKVNHFKTEVGIVEVGAFIITRATKTSKGMKVVKSEFHFDDMKGGRTAYMNAAKRAFNSLMLAGLRGKNTIEFICNKTTQRHLDIYLDLADFEKTEEFGGRGAASAKVNMGNLYETELAQALMNYCAGLPVTKWKSHVDLIVETLQNKLKQPIKKAEHAGGSNTKRPLAVHNNNIVISAEGKIEKNIGKTLTDITLYFGEQEIPIYLSVKFGETLSFFNCGISGGGKGNIALFPAGKLQKGEIPDDGKKYLDMFGINHEDFLSVFAGYKKGSQTATVQDHIRTITLTAPKKAALEELIATGVGYGYWMCHFDGGKLHFYEVDNNYMNRASNLVGNKVEVQYGGATGTGKRINMNFETELYEFSFNIRNKSGGVYPTHSNGDYYKK